jgi:hypothetical protein
MGDGRTEVEFLWEARAMSEQNLLVLAGSVPAGNVPALNTIVLIVLRLNKRVHLLQSVRL